MADTTNPANLAATLAGASTPPEVELLAERLAEAGIVNQFAPGLDSRKAAPLASHGLRVLATRRAAGRRIPERVCWTWIRYRQHFRPPMSLRSLAHLDGTRSRELTVDLAQMSSTAELERRIAAALDGPARAPGVDIGRYGLAGANPLWCFNATFWRHMPGYMAAAGRGVRDSIGGSPDSDPTRACEHARRFCAQARSANAAGGGAPARPFVYLDVGVANTGYADTMIRRLASARQAADYVVADYSRSALQRARKRLGDRRGTVSVRYVHFDLQAPEPPTELAACGGRILAVHLTNLLDNLPGDELFQVGGRHYLLHTCLYLPADSLTGLAERHRLDRERLADDLSGIAAGSVDGFLAAYRGRFAARRSGADGERAWYLFWQDLFGNPDDPGGGLKLRERLMEVANPARAEAWPAPAGALPEAVLAPAADRRIPLSDRAIAACLRLMRLLHPRGLLEITDLLIRDRSGAAPYASYHGPVKYDGSSVSWINGGLLALTVRREFPACRIRWRPLEAGKRHMTCLEIQRGAP